MTRRYISAVVALAVLQACAWTPPPRPDLPPAGMPELPELTPVGTNIRDACDSVQPDGSVVCQAGDLAAADHVAIDLYHDGRRCKAVAISERRHRQIDGEAYHATLDDRDAALRDARWDFWRGLVWGVVGAGMTAAAAWGGLELSRAIK